MKGILSTRRHLKKLASEERCFANHTSPVISKQIIAKAQGTRHGIALEKLMAFRERITAHKPRRAMLSRWFNDLRQEIEYKAQRVGILVGRLIPVTPIGLVP